MGLALPLQRPLLPAIDVRAQQDLSALWTGLGSDGVHVGLWGSTAAWGSLQLPLLFERLGGQDPAA